MLDSDRGYATSRSTTAPRAATRSSGSSPPALGFIGRPDSQDALRQLMQSEDARVRLAAAAAVLQLKRGA